jgi:DNA-binding NarL/FixJ family response regulator
LKVDEISVLIVDDKPVEADQLQTALSHAARVTVKHPSKVVLDDASDADLILVDFTLEDWPSRDGAGEITQRPANGLAVISILESYTAESPTGYALYSANLDRLSRRLASPHLEHAIARLHNIEWAFPKSTNPRLLSNQIVSLARALKSASGLLLSDDAQESRTGAQQMLGLDMTSAWHDEAWRDVERCFPPLYELSEASHGRAFVRWLAHRVVPYPTFVIEAAYVGAALGLPLPIEGGNVPNSVASFLEPVQYRGALNDLIGPRWWRAGLDYLLNERRGEIENPSELRSSLAADFKIAMPDVSEPVVFVDSSYVPTGITSVQDAVRIQPDDWPAFADAAWVRIEDVADDNALAALVMEDDRHLIEQSDSDVAI